MEWLASAFETETAIAEIALRLGVACILGATLGIEREWRDRPAGLRTHMLVALAAACFTLLSLELVADAADMSDAVRADPIRLLEAVIAGVAFLGAGTIIRGGPSRVKGVTTGASIWLAGGLGVAAGAGHYVIGVLTAVLAVVILSVIRAMERPLARRQEPDNESGGA